MAVITAVNGVWISFCLVCRPLRKVGPHQAACCHVSPPSSKSTYVCVHCYKCVCVCVCPLLQVCVCVCVCVCVSVPTAPGVCALGWVKCREHISLLVILCIIMYVTKKNIYIFFFFFLPISDYGKMLHIRINIGKLIYRSIST